MRHKLFLALQELPETGQPPLEGVSELDATFVLECYKGQASSRNCRPQDPQAWCKGVETRHLQRICLHLYRHPAKGRCLCRFDQPGKTGCGRVGRDFYKPYRPGCPSTVRWVQELPKLCRSYGLYREGLPWTEEEKGFFNLNTVNGFPSFIKHRYHFYQGVTTKYLNKYNVLFSASYHKAEIPISRLCLVLLSAGDTDYYHSVKEVWKLRLLEF